LARIFIVDDHHHYRLQLRTLLESVEDWEVCGEAENGWEAVEKHSWIQPHVTVMDFNMPELNGPHASRAILRKCPEATILLLNTLRDTAACSPSKKRKYKRFLFQDSDWLHNSGDSLATQGRDVFS
jgi:DNA-binding NarL/FixJ family response regulator